MSQLCPSRLTLATAVAAVAAAVVPATLHAAVGGGNLLVLRVGDGSTLPATNGSVPVFIDEYTTAGTLVTSYPVPATGASALTIGWNTTTEGAGSLSTDGRYFVFAGYRKDAGGAAPHPDAADVTPRVIGRFELSTGVVDTSTVISSTAGGTADFFGGSSVRGVASTDGTQFWVSGVSSPTAGSGVVYTNGFGPAAVSTLIHQQNYRGIAIAGGDLYSTRASSVLKWTGLPTELTAPTSTPFTKGSGQDYEGMLFLDLSDTVPGVDTIYAPNNDLIEKWVLDPTGTTWSEVGTIATGVTGDVRHLTAGEVSTDTSGNISVPLFFSTVGNPTTVTSIIGLVTDVSQFGAAPTGTTSTIASGPANTSFRAIALAPDTTPPRIPGDTNGDGTVDLADLNNVLNNFGATGASPGDDDGNGVVDLADLNRVLNNFGDTAAASALSAVPEPSALAGLLAALPLISRRRRRA